MAVRMSAGAVQVALREMGAVLEADGYGLIASVEEGRVRLEVHAGPDACPDCLVPKQVFASMALSRLVGADMAFDASEIDVTYPLDLGADAS
jgi:hypothetical protein